MKNNKKFMSIVAGVAIASQLLPISSVVANAQDKICYTHGCHHESKDKTYCYGNDIDVFAENGQDGINIKFGTKKDKELHVTPLGDSENCLLNNKDEKDYLTVKLVDGKGKEKEGCTFNFKGNDSIETVVNKLNGTKFNIGDGLQIRIDKSESRITDYEKDSHVKISGFVSDTPSCYAVGIPKRSINACTFVIGEDGLQYKEYVK